MTKICKILQLFDLHVQRKMFQSAYYFRHQISNIWEFYLTIMWRKKFKAQFYYDKPLEIQNLSLFLKV